MTNEEFVQLTRGNFGFLVDEFGFVLRPCTSDPQIGVSVTYAKPGIEVELRWEKPAQDEFVMVLVNETNLDLIIDRRAPEYQPVCNVRTRRFTDSEIDATLRRYSEFLRKHARDVLDGDLRIIDEIGRLMEQSPEMRTFGRGIWGTFFQPRPRPGDVFAMQPENQVFIYGRVIRTDAAVGDIDRCLLVYIYRRVSSVLKPVPRLDRNDLLLPPVLTGDDMFALDYAKIIVRAPLTSEDVLPVHCFRDSDGVYHDEYNHILPGIVEPCGIYGAQCDFRRIYEALGLMLPQPPSRR